MKHVRKNSGPKRKTTIIILLIIGFVTALVVGIIWAFDAKRQADTIPSQKTNQDGSAPEQQVTPDPDVPGGGSSDRGDSGTTLAAPSGTFVSHHRPSISGNGGPTELFSSCVVETPGASCSISFTKGTVVKRLEKKTVDSDNTASWQWDINEIGITAGDWTIEAIATYGDEKQATKDPVKLEVRP